MLKIYLAGILSKRLIQLGELNLVLFERHLEHGNADNFSGHCCYNFSGREGFGRMVLISGWREESTMETKDDA